VTGKIGYAVALVATILAAFFGYEYYFADTHAKGNGAPTPPVYVEIPSLSVRLADTGTEHYIKVTPVLAVKKGSEQLIKDRLPVVRDLMVTVISAKQSSELMTPQGNAGLKKELVEALDRSFHDGVVAVYFSDYLVE